MTKTIRVYGCVLRTTFFSCIHWIPDSHFSILFKWSFFPKFWRKVLFYLSNTWSLTKTFANLQIAVPICCFRFWHLFCFLSRAHTCVWWWLQLNRSFSCNRTITLKQSLEASALSFVFDVVWIPKVIFCVNEMETKKQEPPKISC